MAARLRGRQAYRARGATPIANPCPSRYGIGARQALPARLLAAPGDLGAPLSGLREPDRDRLLAALHLAALAAAAPLKSSPLPSPHRTLDALSRGSAIPATFRAPPGGPPLRH